MSLLCLLKEMYTYFMPKVQSYGVFFSRRIGLYYNFCYFIAFSEIENILYSILDIILNIQLYHILGILHLFYQCNTLCISYTASYSFKHIVEDFV